MKKLIILALLAGGAWFVATQTSLLGTPHQEAVNTYKAFMDHYIIRNYKDAESYTTGAAYSKIQDDIGNTTMEFMGRTIKTALGEPGILEGSRIKVQEAEERNDRVHLTVLYSASISWGGAMANKMSPDSWHRWNQTAVMEKVKGQWKVARFTSQPTQSQ